MSLELYHNDMSTCAQKVRLTLSEKGLEWTSHHLDLRKGESRTDKYLKINPSGVVPTLVDSGKIICESTVIMEYLDDAFPSTGVRPANPIDRAKVRAWTKQLDEGLHAHIGTISGTVAFRHQYFYDRTEEEVIDFINTIPDLQRRERIMDTTFNGVESHYFKPAIISWKKVFSDMEETLHEAPWLAGQEYSLADIAYTPYLTRMEHLQFMGLLKNRPKTLDWFERIKARPNYSAISEWINKKYIPLMEEKGNEAWPRVKEILNTSI